MFNRSNSADNSADFVTRDEAQRALAELTNRVTALEELAAQLRRGGVGTVPTVRAEAPATSVRATGGGVSANEVSTAAESLRRDAARQFERVQSALAALDTKVDRLTGAGTNVAARTVPAPVPVSVASGVDYGAVAFGLAEIKRNVASLISSGVNIDSTRVQRQYADTVQYFADVFKVDPSFREDEFKRAAGA